MFAVVVIPAGGNVRLTQVCPAARTQVWHCAGAGPPMVGAILGRARAACACQDAPLAGGPAMSYGFEMFAIVVRFSRSIISSSLAACAYRSV